MKKDIESTLKKQLLKRDQKEVNTTLLEVSKRLQVLLPDPSLGPMERLERLARVCIDTIQTGKYHRTARSKLAEIENKLDELVPNTQLSPVEKVNFLVDKIEELVPEKTDRICQKLQFIGDNRLRDNGSIPYQGWSINDLDLDSILKEKRDNKVNPNKYPYID